MNKKNKKNKKGFAAVITVLGISALALVVVTNLTSLIISRQKTARNLLYSVQSYYTAEAGVEDALLRIFDVDLQQPLTSYNLTVGGASANVILDQSIGGQTIITAQGNQNNRNRSLQTVIRINTDEANFNFGVQATAGGVEMDNNAVINGNLYSNSSIVGANGAEITGDVVVAGDGSSSNKIEHLEIGGDAFAPNLINCEIDGNATYLVGGSISQCDVEGSTIVQSEPIETADMPISQETIDDWKQEAQNGDIIADGDYSPDEGTHNIGPGVIKGNVILGNNQTIILNGTVYVQGYIDIKNGASIRLASEYGSNSGILIADNWVEIKNNGIFGGSGQTGSYLMILSQSSCNGTVSTNCSSGKAAMEIHNNADGVIFYASDGLLYLHNNVSLTQATGWRIFLDNGAVVNYALGLESTLFSGGPGASYLIDSWKEVE